MNNWDKGVAPAIFPCILSAGEFKLDGVGPADNRPYSAKLHHFVQKKKM